jgi:hypothetical protein
VAANGLRLLLYACLGKLQGTQLLSSIQSSHTIVLTSPDRAEAGHSVVLGIGGLVDHHRPSAAVSRLNA